MLSIARKGSFCPHRFGHTAIFTFNKRSLPINITSTPYFNVVTQVKYQFDRLTEQIIVQQKESTPTYQYGITRKITNAPVDKHLRDLLQGQQPDTRALAASSIGALGSEQFELDILDHIARHDISLQVRAAARLAISSITARLMG